MKGEELVTLWTRQDIKSLDIIKKTGIYRVKREYIEDQFEDITDHYLSAYKWLVKAAAKIVPKPEGVEYMVWCSISDKNMLRPIPNTIVYKLKLPKQKVVYLDGSKWDYVLNHMYIPKDHEDEKAYREEMRDKGFNDSVSLIKGKYAHFYPLERQKIIDSWDRVFQIDNWNIFSTQANIWEIREDMIIETETYGAL